MYAKGNEDAHTHVVRRAGVRIVTHALDLDQEPRALLAFLTDLATQMVATASVRNLVLPAVGG